MIRMKNRIKTVQLILALLCTTFFPVPAYAAIDTTNLAGDIYSSTVPSGGVTPTTDTYQLYSYDFTATKTSTSISFLFRKDPGYFYMDEISVQLKAGGSELISNGGFETIGGDSKPVNWSFVGTQGLGAAGQADNTSGYAQAGSWCWYDGAVGGFDGIQQDIATSIGSEYTISFYLKADSWSNVQANTTDPYSDTITEVLVYAGGLPSGFVVTPGSNIAALTSVASETDGAPGGGDGSTTGTAITWNISIPTATSELGLSDIESSTVNLYSDSDFTNEITGSNKIALTEGGATPLYIKVTSVDTTAVKYFTVIVNRAAPISSNAALTSVLSQTDSAPAGGAGTSTSTAITWSVSVSNSDDVLGLTGISAASNTTKKLFTDDSFTTEITGSGTIALSAGGNTTVYVKVTAEDTTTIKYYAVTISRAAASSGGGGGSNKITPAQSDVPVIVNGQSESAGTQTQTVVDGIKNITVDVNEATINKKIDNILAVSSTTGTENNTIEIPVASSSGDTVRVSLAGDLIQKMENNSFTLEVTSKDVHYMIPAEELKISDIAEALGTENNVDNVEIRVNIVQPTAETLAKITSQANAQDYEIVIPPVSFEVTAINTATKEEKEINKFSNYVQRMFEIPAGVDPSKITTGILYNDDGTFSHIPTELVIIDGKYYAKLNSLTNSIYSVVWNPITVASVENHWSKEAVNDLASRLVIENPETFNPNEKITRGEFAEYITKALGIYRTGVAKAGMFTDVKQTDKLADAIMTAVDYGIIKGYTDGSFKPNATITREEAMVMYNRAMSITNLEGTDLNRINNYTDYSLVSGWAKENVKQVIAAKVFNGTSEKTLAPKANLTMAEAATAVSNLLIQSNLIND